MLYVFSAPLGFQNINFLCFEWKFLLNDIRHLQLRKNEQCSFPVAVRKVRTPVATVSGAT